MKTAILILAVLFLAASVTTAQDEASGGDDVLKKASYGIGYQTGMNFSQQGVDLDLDAVFQGIRDGLSGAELGYPPEELQAAMGALQQMVESQRQEAATRHASEAEAYLAETAQRDGVVTLASGLQYEVMVEGEGATPQSTDSVRVHYHGMLIDGTVFDSSVERGEPVVFPVTGVIPGWIEALQLMQVGSKWKLHIPPALAYGENGQGPIPPNAALVFEVELLGIE